jgi:putative ABC transport system permease protein
VQTLLQDLRYAARNLLRSRGFALVAALTLAIGIGANAAVFSVIDAALLRPLPYRNPDQLVRLYRTESAPGNYGFTGPDFVEWKAQNRTLQDMTLFYEWPRDMNLAGEGQADHVLAAPTAANFFTLLGVDPLIGRTWARGEDQPGKDQVAVLGYGLWRSRFAGDPDIVGRSIELDARKYTVIGVMPSNFRFPTGAQLWTPLDMSPKNLGRRGANVAFASAIGRLKPDATIRTAQADLALVASRLERTYPDSNYKVGAVVMSLHDDLVGESHDSLVMMLTSVGLVLLIACANIANLLLSRAVARQREIAIRGALGASRSRVFRQLLTESLLLAVVGGAAGLLLAWGLIVLVPRVQSFTLPQFNLIQLNRAVLSFTFALAVATGVLFGLVPALQTSRPDLCGELAGGPGGSISPGRRRRLTSSILVAGEVALSLVLLISSGLLLKDFVRVRGLNTGVRPQGVWTAAVRLPGARYETAQQKFDFSRALLDQARQVPGVESSAVSDRLPLEGGNNRYVYIRGETAKPMSGPLVEMHAVSPGYFRVMGIPLLKGRVFTPADEQAALASSARARRLFGPSDNPPAEETNAIVFPTVINESMARFFWPNQDPLGQMFSPRNENGPWRQVIGVVGDVRQWGLVHEPVPEEYDVFDGRPGTRLFLVLHTSRAPSSLTAEVRRALSRIDSTLPLFSVRTMDEVIADNAQGQQFLSLLVGSFAALAVLLAAIGIYGVLSYVVTQRTREIGIRMSLGATRGRVLAEVLVEGMRLAIFGFLVGIAGALAAGRVMQSLLNEVKPHDPLIFTATTSALAAVALMACYLPSRRAARLEPMSALRYE